MWCCPAAPGRSVYDVNAQRSDVGADQVLIVGHPDTRDVSANTAAPDYPRVVTTKRAAAAIAH